MHKEIVIIGAGQGGLAAGRFLQKENRDFLILEKHRQVGENWRKKFDSLRLFTPAAYSALPDLPLALAPKTRPTKNQIADYFNRYAEHFDLPVSVNEEVKSITQENGCFKIETSLKTISSDKIIVANGFSETPNLPDWAAGLDIPYLHSCEYKSPSSIKGKKVLVVGAGNSGAQIAAELIKYYQVHWSTIGKPKFASLHLFGKNVFWLADKFGRLDKPLSEKKIKKKDPIYLYDDLKKQLKKTIRNKEVIAASGDKITFEGGEVEAFDFVIFATGFQSDFNFIHIKNFENNMDQLRSQQGISQVEGLYFLGIPFQRSRSSHLIYGSQKDAFFLVKQIIDH